MTFRAVSRRGMDRPMISQSFGSLSLTSLGGSILAAAAANVPNVAERPEALWLNTLPLAEFQSRVHPTPLRLP